MGSATSRFAKALDGVDENERYFGLDNFGNTCYCNSILQALYSCKLFRRRLIDYVATIPPEDQEEGVLTALADLFREIESQSKQSGSISPQRFITAVKRSDERFRNYMHQDAQEFMNFLLDALLERVTTLERRRAEAAVNGAGGAGGAAPEGGGSGRRPPPTFVHHIFCGKTVSQTRCMNCENATKREESFMELTLEIEQPDTTLERCLTAFSHKELLDMDNKFFCDSCNSYQEAQKWVDIKSAPPVLIFHLNRLGFMHHLGRERKLKHRVVFSQRMSLPNRADSSDEVYDLFAVVAHVGSGAHHGHYVSFVLSGGGKWVCFDDHNVCVVSEDTVRATYGHPSEYGGQSDMHAYVLFYQNASLAAAEAPEPPSENPSL